VLTAAAAILALLPLAFSVFWGPMAIAIMGGLVSATLLTLCFVPALYAAWTKAPRGSTQGGSVDRQDALKLGVPVDKLVLQRADNMQG
jgi:hypothetical protein